LIGYRVGVRQKAPPFNNYTHLFVICELVFFVYYYCSPLTPYALPMPDYQLPVTIKKEGYLLTKILIKKLIYQNFIARIFG